MAREGIENRRPHERTRYYLTYTGLFLVLLFLVFLCFLLYDRQLLWLPDGLTYFSEWKELGSRSLFAGGFSFERGLGSGNQEMGVIRAFFYPVLLLAYVWPADRFETLYALRVVIGYYLAGVSFSVFARKFSKKTLPVLAGAMVYVFSGYMLKYGCRHVFFSESIVLFLPLILLGVERILRGESGWTLTVAVFFLAMESVYYLYMAAIMAGVYFLVRFFTFESADRKRGPALFASCLARTAAAAVMGCLMGAVSLVPSLRGIFHGGRIGNTKSFPALLYTVSKYEDLAGYFFAAERHHVQGFPAIVFPAVILLFTGKGVRGRRSLRWFWIVGLLCLCLPIFAFVCSGFSNVTDRWGIGLTLAAGMIVVLFLDRAEPLPARRMLLCALCFAAYAAVCLVYRDGVTVRAGIGMIAVTLAVLFALGRVRPDTAEKIGRPVLLALTCVSLCLNAFMLYSPVGDDYQASFAKRGEVDALYMNNSLEGLAAYLEDRGDDSFFRVAGQDIATVSDNAQMAYDLNGVAEFNSMDLSYLNYLLENDAASLEFTTSKYGMDNRTAMMEIAGVKYYSAPADAAYAVPYGYALADTVETASGTYDIYENEYALPIGYAYGSYITRGEYESMEVLDRQNALMQAVLLEEDTEQIPRAAEGLSLTAVRNRILSAEYDNVTLENGVLKVGKGGGSITFTIEPVRGELYVHVVGMHMEDSTGKWTVSADTETANAFTYYRGDDYTYYTNADRLLNLGTADEPAETVTVRFSRRGTFPLESVEILTQPMDEYAGQAEALLSESLRNVTVRGGTITGDITVRGGRVLCLAIPYSTVSGWTAYVDGQETELFQANTFYMGLELKAGEHSIRLEYRSPLLLECGIVSAVSTTVFIGFRIWAAQRRRRAGCPCRKEAHSS